MRASSASFSSARERLPEATTATTYDLGGRTIEITHPDRVLFPDDGITKADLAAYHHAVAPVLVAHLAERQAVVDQRRELREDRGGVGRDGDAEALGQLRDPGELVRRGRDHRAAQALRRANAVEHPPM